MYYTYYIMKQYKQDQTTFDSIISKNIKIKNVPGFYGPNDKWLASEELVLLTSLQHFSFGNWSTHADILSKNCKKNFTPEEVREHYFSTYLEGDISEAMKNIRDISFKNSLTDHTTKDDDELLNSVDRNAQNVPADFLKQLGYQPLRLDFKEEYAPNAENLLYDLNFKEVDKYDKNVNLLVLDAYRYTVKERMKLKNAVKEFRLVERYHAASKNEFTHLNSGNILNNLNAENESPIKTRSNSKNHSVCNNLEKQDSLHSKELSEAELELCADLGIKQKFYIHYKAFLQRVDLKKVAGEFNNDFIMIPEDLTVSQCLRIVNFLKKSGWIKTKNLLNVHD